MKTRHGFISNSSSSSFIVALDHKPATIEETIQMFFGDNPPEYIGDFTSQSLAQRLFDDIVPQSPLDIGEVERKTAGGYILGAFDDDADYYRSPNRKDGQSYEDWLVEYDQWLDDSDAAREAAQVEYVHNFLACSNVIDKQLFEFNYGDENGGFESELEHGPTFDRVPHIRISNH